MSLTVRCSELDRVLLCNGSITLAPLVNDRQGDESFEGVALHWLAHERIQKELGATGEIGPKPPIPASVKFSIWIADFYFRTVRDIVPANWSLECECALAYELNGFSLSGHIDDIAISPDATEAIGFDLKTGYAPVDIAECNEQILGYLILLVIAYPTLRKATFYIVQPRNDEDEGFPRISDVTVEGDTLAALRASLECRMNKAIANRLEVNTGVKQCAWCSAATQCPAAIAERELMKVQLTPEMLANIKREPDDATLAEWVIAKKVLSRPLEDATELVKERIRQAGYVQTREGGTIRMKTQGGHYSFPDRAAFYHATRAIIPDDDKYAQTVKPSVTATKDMIAEVLNIPKTSKNGQSAQSVFDGQLGHLCEQGKKEVLIYE